MINDLKNSIKAKLYDFTYTPFLSSVVISWILLNHKYLLIYFGDSKLEEKLQLLKDYDFSFKYTGDVINFAIPYAMNIFFPILFGLFYVFIYPLFSKVFYGYTLKRTKKLKEIKQDIEDKTPITNEEAREIRQVIDNHQEERDKLIKKSINAEKIAYDKAKQIYDNYISPEQHEKLQEKNKDLKTQLQSLQQEYDSEKLIVEKNKITYGEVKKIKEENNQLKKQIKNKDLQNTNLTSKIQDLRGQLPIIEKEDDETRILRFFYELNKESSTKNNILTDIVSSMKVARPKASKILEKLIKDGILSLDSNNYIKLTEKGNNALVVIFDKTHNKYLEEK